VVALHIRICHLGAAKDSERSAGIMTTYRKLALSHLSLLKVLAELPVGADLPTLDSEAGSPDAPLSFLKCVKMCIYFARTKNAG